MKDGRDPQDTHESMQINRVKNKYENNPKRHVGKNKSQLRSKQK